MEKNIKPCLNSSGKTFGQVIFCEEQIIIENNSKPVLTIDDEEVLKEIKNKNENFIVFLYDNLHLCIGEIAAIYGLSYSTTNRKLKSLNPTSGKNDGRRNPTYGKQHSEETKRKIGEKSKGRLGCGQYERTPEIKKKISDSLKQYFQENEVSDETRKKLSQAWVDGKYKNSPMGRGIHGYFYSHKNNKQFYFRSLLELFYLIKIEEDILIQEYQVEPFQISIDKTHHYTPDFLLNKKDIKELKPHNHLKFTKENERFSQEVRSANIYAQENNMTFEIIYDIDIGFETKHFQRWLKNNPHIIDLYKISFDKDINSWS